MTDEELDRMRAYAQAAREHPTWSVAYAQDVPRLLFEVERLTGALDQVVNDGSLEPIKRRQIARHTLAGVVYQEPVEHDKLWYRLRFAEMVLDRVNAEIDGVPWREAARLSEALDGEPVTEPAVLVEEESEPPRAIEVLRDTLTHIAYESDMTVEGLQRWALGALVAIWPDDFTPVAPASDPGVQS